MVADSLLLCSRALPGRWLPRGFRPLHWEGTARAHASLRTCRTQVSHRGRHLLFPGVNKASVLCPVL